MADDDIADLIYSQSRQARAAALGALDEDHDPDKAGEALRLGQVTGANPSLIYPDPQEYQRRVKSHIVDEFLRTNPNLQDYANSHPLAPVVSANDWPKLDALDQSLSAFARGGKSVTAAAVKGFKDHFDLNDALGTEMGEKVKDNRLLWSITTGLTQPLYALGVGLPMQTFTAGLAGLKEGLVEAQKQAGVSEGHAEYNARQLTSLVEARLMRTEGAPHSVAKQVNENLRREVGRAMPFVEAGESPPAALGGLVAEARKLEDKEAAKHIDELMKSAGETETKALAPDLLKENFIKPKVEDARVGLDAKALDILYPEGKIPEEDDGILGWVPNIQEQVARARATGADIDIPLADFAAKMDPTVLREVKDHIRPRAGSRTPEEWKRPPDEPKAGEPPAEPALDFDAEVAKLREQAPTPEVSKVLQDFEALRQKLAERPEFEPGVDLESDMAELEADLTKVPKDSPVLAKLRELQQGLVEGMEREPAEAKPIEAAAPPLPEARIPRRKLYEAEGKTDIENYKYVTEDVPISWLERLPGNALRRDIGPLAESIEKEGIKNPLIITVGKNTGTAKLGEGNHRLAALKSLGYTHAPVRVIVGSEYGIEKLPFSDQKGNLIPQKGEYFKADAKPSEVFKDLQAAKRPNPLVETLRDVSGMSAKGWDKVSAELTRPEYEGEPGIIPEKTIAGEPVGKYDIKSNLAFPLADALDKIEPERLTGVTKTLNDFFGERLQRLVGDVPVKLLDFEGMKALSEARDNRFDPNAHGLYLLPEHEIVLRDGVALGALGHARAAHVLMHEGAHAMTIVALEQNPRLKALAKELMDEADAALTKAQPSERSLHSYAFTNEREFLAEAMANSAVRDLTSVLPLSKELAAKLGLDRERGNTVWDAVRRIVKDILERVIGRKVPPTVLDGVLELGRQIEKELTREKLEGQALDKLVGEFAAPPGEPIPEYLEKAFASGKALRMNNERLRRHLELAAQQHKEDIDFSKNQETLAAGKQATKDWKDNVDRVRRESRETVSAQPDIAVDRYLREGILPNESKEPKVKLHRGSIPDEYRNRIPRDYMDANRGVHPDQLATRFGYQSGREVLEHLARLDEQRTLEGLTPAAYITQRVEAETQRRMERDYGRSAEDILGNAKDHIFSPTTHDILHNELAALYEMNGQQPITKEQLKQHAKVIYDRLPHTMHSSSGYMAEMSRMREEVIDNLLEGKNVDALAAQQKIALLAYQAEFARKTEKLRGQFDRAWENKWQRREPPGMEQKDAIALHEIAMKFGLRPKRVAGDIERQKQLLGYTNLQDYVNHITDLANQTPDVMNPGQVPIASWLVPDSPHPRNKWPEFDDLTHQELEDVFTSMKAIDHYSRNEKKYRVKGELADLADVQKGLIERLKAAVDYKQISPGRKQEPSIPRMIGSVLLNPESWAFRLDLGNALGPFNQLIIRPIMEGLYEERKLEREFNELWSKLPKIEKREAVVNPGLFKDPANPAELMELDTHSLRAIIQNMGNPRQREKLARGYGIDNPDKIWDWLFNTVGITKEHFDFARQMAGIFEKAFEGTEKADIKRYGVAPQRIELGEIQTPWGVEKEWYHPLIADSTRHSTMLKAEDMIDESGFYRPAPASGFKKERTGATYPIDLTFDLVPYKLRQILKYNAMAWRVAEVSKIILNKDFRTAFKQYYGVEYEGALIKWLKDSAGNREWDPAGDRAIAGSVKYLQDNLSSAMIGFNLGTVLKHGPTALVYSAKQAGPINFAESALKMIREWPGAQEAWQQAHEKSAEISSRWRSMKENIQGTNEELFNKLDPTRKFLTIREAIQLAGHYPVAIVDLFSAVPMWDAVYRDGIKRGLAETDAVYAADTAVRRTHGSTIIGARAGIMRTRDPYGLVKTFMPFYNFMSNALQRNWEMGWRARLAMTGRELPEMTGFEKETYEKGFKNLKFALGGIMVYGVLTSLIEQAVDPLPAGKDEGNLSYWGRALTRAYPSQIPFARDIFNAIFHGRDPSTGLVGSFARNVAEEFKPGTWVGMDPAKIWRKTNTLVGTLTGLTNEQVGKVGTYIFNLSKGKEQSIKGPTDAYEVYRHGTLKKQPRSIEELGREIGGARR